MNCRLSVCAASLVVSGLLAHSAAAQSARSGVGAIPYAAGAVHGVTFRVWAPHATNVSVAGNFNGWDMATNPLATEGNGYWSADCTNAAAGAEYKYVINSNLWRRDPRGLSVVNSAGNSIVFDPNAYDWDVDSFARPERKDAVIYAMHVRTYSPQWSQWPQGTFDTAIAKLDHLQELGVNTIELMPIMEFPGDNSWGYNPSDPYAVESAYGGSRKLQEFVDACHTRKMAVVLDVVHNHWGPSDLATWQFDGYAPVAEYGGIYHYNSAGLCCTDWGATRPNYAAAEVRDYIKDNFSAWLDQFHVDGFRTDSPFHIGYYDTGSGTAGNADGVSLMQEFNARIHNNYSNVVSIQENGDATWGFDCRWDMDFMEDLRALVAEPSDANRDMNALAGMINSGAGLGRVLYVESHDTAGDLNGNTRLAKLIDSNDPASYWARKRSLLAAAVYLTSPGIPMIFQGEEMMEYWSFSDHTGYRWDATTSEYHRGHIAAYKALVHARRNLKGGTQGLKGSNCDVYHVDNANKVIAYKRWDAGGDDVVVVANFGITAWTNHNYSIEFPSAGTWYAHFNSDQTNYYGDFNNVGSASVVAAGSPPAANVDMGRYSALIFSKTPPATGGTASAGPVNNGCDQPVSFTYDPAGGPLEGAAQVRMFIGHDGWQNSFYTNMTRASYDTNVWLCSYSDFPGGTRGLNYAFTDGSGAAWDNNFAKDWYVAVGCHSTMDFAPAQPTGCSEVTFTYQAADGPLATATQVFAHVGQNNWELIVDPDVRLTALGNGVWSGTYSLRDPAYSLNVCFNDGQGGWDTHYNNNWNVNVQDCHTNTGNVWLDPAQPYGCDPITFRYAPAAGPLAGATNVNLFIGRDGWLDVATLPMAQDTSGVWTVVYQPARGCDWINFVFNAGPTNSLTWDNNYTKDWNYSVYCSPQDGWVTLAPENPVGCVPLTITYAQLPECPLENATNVFVRIVDANTGGTVAEALPMTEVSNGVWQTEYFTPPGTQWIYLYFHDNQGTADYLRKTEYWYAYFQNCAPADAVAITNPICEWHDAGAASVLVLQGVVESGQGSDLVWTNALTGQHGALTATSVWEVAGIALQPGTNAITIGTRVYGAPAFDSPTNAAYADGWQLGDNGGTGFTAWTQTYASAANLSLSDASVLGPKAWQFDNPAQWQYYSADRLFGHTLVAGDSIRFKLDLAHGTGLYQFIDLFSENGNWLASLSSSPYMSNMVSIMAANYNTLPLPATTAGLDYQFDLLSASNAWLTITSRSSGDFIATNVMFYDSGNSSLKRVSFGCMDAGNQVGGQYFQLADLQVVPGVQGEWISDTVLVVSAAAVDSDGDGMPDDWETAHGLNPHLDDAAGDGDFDGRNNLEEYQADTHPGNPNSMLCFDRVSMTGNVLQLVWQGGSNAVQIVQCSSNLVSGWRDWLTNLPPTPVTNAWSQTNFAQTNRLFFRFKAHR